MKRLLISLLCLFMLSACSSSNVVSEGYEDKYEDLIELLNSNVEFEDSSELFDITSEISKTTNGYRFYIVIDNPKVAMYNIEAVAIEKGVDYTTTMAANIGIFEDEYYSLIPNQTYVDEGYVKGVSISALTDNPAPNLYLLVEWHNKDLSITNRQFIKISLDVNKNDEVVTVPEETTEIDENQEDVNE